MALGGLLKELAIAVGTAAAEALVRPLVRLIRGKRRDSLPEVDVPVSEPPHVRFTDIERIRRLERESIAASKAAEEAKRREATTRPARPKPGTLPK